MALFPLQRIVRLLVLYFCYQSFRALMLFADWLQLLLTLGDELFIAQDSFGVDHAVGKEWRWGKQIFEMGYDGFDQLFWNKMKKLVYGRYLHRIDQEITVVYKEIMLIYFILTFRIILINDFPYLSKYYILRLPSFQIIL